MYQGFGKTEKAIQKIKVALADVLCYYLNYLLFNSRRLVMTHTHKKISRRRFLRDGSAVAAAMSFPAVLTSRKAAAAETLNLLAWYGNGEPDIVAPFEAATGVKVQSKYYTGGDNMLALIGESPPGTYDVILSDAEYVSALAQAGYLEKMTADDYPLDDFFPEFQQFPVQGFWKDSDLYAIPCSFGILGVSYNTEKLSAKDAMSYELLWQDKVQGKVGLFDWHLPNLLCLSLYNGNTDPSPNDISATAWRKLQETTLSLRPQVKGFFDYGGTLSSLKNGEVIAMCGIGDWITGVLQKDGYPVDTVIPEEGGIMFTEALGIGKNSGKAELARKFVQYFTSPEGQVRKAKMAAYPTSVPNKKAWEIYNKQDPGESRRSRMLLSEANVMDDVRSGRVYIRQWPTQQTLADWNDFWIEFKNA